MSKIIVSILCMLMICSATNISYSQKKAEGKTMAWTTKSAEAKKLASSGANHLMNVELALAYADFMSAIKLDPDFTVALVFLSNLTRGATQKTFAQRAQKSAANKTDGEKLFASLTEENMTPERRRDIWGKLHAMYPDGEMIGHYYVVTRASVEERLTAAQEYIKKFPDNAAMYNTIAYYYLNDKKDNARAKENFDKYLALYPDGYNPYDSMGEYYLVTGDVENASKYYSLALEKYPFNESSVIALEKIENDKKKGEVKK